MTSVWLLRGFLGKLGMTSLDSRLRGNDSGAKNHTLHRGRVDIAEESGCNGEVHGVGELWENISCKMGDIGL